MTTSVTLEVPVGERDAVARQLLAIAQGQGELTARPERTLREALASGRLAVAREGEELRGWFLSEPGGRRAQELGFVWVHPDERDGALFERMLAPLIALKPRSVAVTFRPGFAAWLVRSHGFRRSTLGEVTRITRGAFLLRRLNPRRLRAAAGHGAGGAGGAPIYLVWDGDRA